MLPQQKRQQRFAGEAEVVGEGVESGTRTVGRKESKVLLSAGEGGWGKDPIADDYQSKGLIQVVDSVLPPAGYLTMHRSAPWLLARVWQESSAVVSEP